MIKLTNRWTTQELDTNSIYYEGPKFGKDPMF